MILKGDIMSPLGKRAEQLTTCRGRVVKPPFYRPDIFSFETDFDLRVTFFSFESFHLRDLQIYVGTRMN